MSYGSFVAFNLSTASFAACSSEAATGSPSRSIGSTPPPSIMDACSPRSLARSVTRRSASANFSQCAFLILLFLRSLSSRLRFQHSIEHPITPSVSCMRRPASSADAASSNSRMSFLRGSVVSHGLSWHRLLSVRTQVPSPFRAKSPGCLRLHHGGRSQANHSSKSSVACNRFSSLGFDHVKSSQVKCLSSDEFRANKSASHHLIKSSQVKLTNESISFQFISFHLIVSGSDSEVAHATTTVGQEQNSGGNG
jgi:hypothetical protein